MKTVKYKYPLRFWVKSLETDKFFSQERMKIDNEMACECMAKLCGVSEDNVSWDARSNSVVVIYED